MLSFVGATTHHILREDLRSTETPSEYKERRYHFDGLVCSCQKSRLATAIRSPISIGRRPRIDPQAPLHPATGSFTGCPASRRARNLECSFAYMVNDDIHH